MDLNILEAEEIVRRALAEDIGTGDITTALTIPPDSLSRGQIVASEDGVIAGLQVAAMAFTILAEADAAGSMANLQGCPPRSGRVSTESSPGSGRPIRVTARHLGPPAEMRGAGDPAEVSFDGRKGLMFRAEVADGAHVRDGDTIAEISGPTAVILTGERTALNFLQRLSGIATKTARFVELVKDTGVRITDTRKTTPGLRILEKCAVRAGGGQNHRFGLYDAVLIKDNHIRAAGGIKEAVQAAKSGAPHTVKVQVEADTLAQVEQALETGAEMILLDNMSPSMLKKAVALCKGRAVTEASGGVTEANIGKIAQTGVDLIAIGALTHSVKALDLSLEIVG